MSTRCIIRNFLLASASLAVVVWPSISKATQLYPTVNVLTWTNTTTGLNIYTNGSYNLTNNALIIQASSPAAAQAAYAYIYSEVSSGYNGTTQSNGGYLAGTPGIVSDATAYTTNTTYYPSAVTDPDGITGIGVVINDGNNASPFQPNDPGWSTWDGVNVNSNSVLVGYTYNGDGFMEGLVGSYDVSDAIDDYLNDPHAGGWSNGESDYSGMVDSTSVSNVIDAYLNQFQDPLVLPTQPAAAFAPDSFGAPVGVPEPATIWMGLLGMAGLLLMLGARSRSRKARSFVVVPQTAC